MTMISPLFARYLRWLSLFSGVLFSCNVFAAADDAAALAPHVYIENFGIYQLLGKSEHSFNAESTAGYDSVISTRFVQQSNTIPLQHGLVFGFNYAVDDVSIDGEWAVIDIEIKHPLTTNYLGHDSNGFKTQGAAKLKADGRYHNGVFYVFSQPYEMVPGEWQITVSYRSTALASQTFDVVLR